MKSFLTIASVLLFIHSCPFLDAKSPLKPGNSGKPGPAKVFPFKNYAEFQISGGTAGNSLEKANKVFVDPFAGVSSEEITQNDLNNLFNMSITAIESEKLFNAAIKKAKGKASQEEPLLLGKTANKILKIVGAIQLIEMQHKVGIPQNNIENRLKELRAKLHVNDKADHHNAGKRMASYLSVGKGKGKKDKEEKETDSSQVRGSKGDGKENEGQKPDKVEQENDETNGKGGEGGGAKKRN